MVYLSERKAYMDSLMDDQQGKMKLLSMESCFKGNTFIMYIIFHNNYTKKCCHKKRVFMNNTKSAKIMTNESCSKISSKHMCH